MRKTTRKIIMVAVMGALLTLLPAGLAMALHVEIRCNEQNPNGPLCEGTNRVNHGDDITGKNDAVRYDYIVAYDGDDVVRARIGNDIVYGGEGDDTIDGGEGNDAINGGEGNNVISGGPGNDVMVAGNGNDRIVDPDRRDTDRVGSAGGNDVVNVRDDNGRDNVNCGAGRNDTVKVDRGDNVAKNCENVRGARR
jgi:Ca2+-binding RTX toxin-like protein